MRIIRVLRLACHVLHAVVIAATVLPLLSAAQRRARVRRFSRQLLEILAVRLRVSGEPPRAQDLPAMLVANHVSWLDIFAINAAQIFGQSDAEIAATQAAQRANQLAAIDEVFGGLHVQLAVLASPPAQIATRGPPAATTLVWPNGSLIPNLSLSSSI